MRLNRRSRNTLLNRSSLNMRLSRLNMRLSSLNMRTRNSLRSRSRSTANPNICNRLLSRNLDTLHTHSLTRFMRLRLELRSTFQG
jgi:hypothetical protein